MTMLQKLNELTDDYKETNWGVISDLYQVAGINTSEVDENNSIIDLLLDRDVIIRSSKFTVKDVAVGQYLVLRKVTGEFIKGSKVWIDLKNYKVHKASLSGDTDIQANGGFDNVTRGPLQ